MVRQQGQAVAIRELRRAGAEPVGLPRVAPRRGRDGRPEAEVADGSRGERDPAELKNAALLDPLDLPVRGVDQRHVVPLRHSKIFSGSRKQYPTP